MAAHGETGRIDALRPAAQLGRDGSGGMPTAVDTPLMYGLGWDTALNPPRMARCGRSHERGGRAMIYPHGRRTPRGDTA
jgi:hypothetical protein